MNKKFLSEGDIVILNYDGRQGRIHKLKRSKAYIEMLEDGEIVVLPYSSFALVQTRKLELGVEPDKSFPSNGG